MIEKGHGMSRVHDLECKKGATWGLSFLGQGRSVFFSFPRSILVDFVVVVVAANDRHHHLGAFRQTLPREDLQSWPQRIPVGPSTRKSVHWEQTH